MDLFDTEVLTYFHVEKICIKDSKKTIAITTMHTIPHNRYFFSRDIVTVMRAINMQSTSPKERIFVRDWVYEISAHPKNLNTS